MPAVRPCIYAYMEMSETSVSKMSPPPYASCFWRVVEHTLTPIMQGLLVSWCHTYTLLHYNDFTLVVHKRESSQKTISDGHTNPVRITDGPGTSCRHVCRPCSVFT